MFYDKAKIKVSDAWKEILNTSLYKSNVCLIIGEEGAFESLKKGEQKDDEFLNEVSFALAQKEKRQSEIIYLAVEGYEPWDDPKIKTISYIQNLRAYQGLSFHFKKRNEGQIKDDIKMVVKQCENLCNKGYLKFFKSFSDSSLYGGQKTKIDITTMREKF